MLHFILSSVKLGNSPGNLISTTTMTVKPNLPQDLLMLPGRWRALSLDQRADTGPSPKQLVRIEQCLLGQYPASKRAHVWIFFSRTAAYLDLFPFPPSFQNIKSTGEGSGIKYQPLDY